MTTSQIGILISIIVYMGAMLVIGFYFSKKSNTTHDFYLGGRKLGPFVTAMSAEASDMSSYLLMGLPGLAYLTGVCDTFWTIAGLALGTYVNWLIVAKRLRKYTVICNNSITIPDFFANRYRDKKVLKCVSAMIIIIFFVPYTASGFAACGKLFNSLFGINYMTAMIISAIVIIAYTSLGGFLAASTTDFIQSIIMTVALAIVVFYGIDSVGGMDQVIANAKDLPGYFSFNSSYNAATNSANQYGIITIISTLAWGLGYFGMPHILLRFMAIDDPENVKLSRRIASTWVVISMAAAILIGIIGFSMSTERILGAYGSFDSETIIVQISTVISKHGFIFAIVAGIILAGILASTMSTSDSQLLAASSSVTENMLDGVFGIKLSEKKKVVVARATVIVISIIAIFLASNPKSNVFQIVSFAWAGFGATFGPVMLFALFWKRSNKYGAIAGMLSGGIMIFLWKYVVRPLGGALDIYELLPAFMVACIFIVVVSLLTPAPEREIVEEFESVKTAQV
ncbi:sodium/proline symporter PutP [Eubacterium sp. CAG:161]|uniref:sodium/proline symporter PutP n=1 Tax=Eubacterium sp. CAG:161 TaxID=1262881 RepID=UPI0003395BEF|nr:sodium/proline symporter PutP [Eubacterium sp. CAG:161]CCY69546.1 putative sodium/proline symporter [Eubacterium sp. CAG:161]